MRDKEATTDAIGFNVNASSPAITAAAVQTKTRDPNRFCTHCSRKGHDVSECFLLHGYPEWYLEQQQSSRGSTRGRGASSRGGRGRGASVANAVANPAQMGSLPSSEQIATLITLLKNQQPLTTTDKVSGKTKLTDIVIDTGASHHMTGDRSLLQELRPVLSSDVRFPDGRISRATHIGNLVLNDKYTLRDILFVPSFNCTLFSVHKLIKQTGCIAVFTDTLCVLQDRFTKTLIGVGEEREGIYYFTRVTTSAVSAPRVSSIKATTSTNLWHQRLGHPSSQVLSTLPFFNNVSIDLDITKGCDTCFRSKQTRGVFHESFNKAASSFELIHCDVWGPYRTLSSCGASYFLTIVDDYSRAVWVFLMLEKSEVPSLIRSFFAMAVRQFSKHVKIIRTDNGTEFVNHNLQHFFRQQGIIHQTSCVDTPQQNGRVERKHRHILNVARACLFQAKLPVKFWGESVLTAAFLINRTPTPLLSGKTPYEMLHNSPPNYDVFLVFGCLCYASSKRRDKDKFGSRSRRCIFVGYPLGKKAWKLYDLEKDEFLYSRDVVFVESSFLQSRFL